MLDLKKKREEIDISELISWESFLECLEVIYSLPDCIL